MPLKARELKEQVTQEERKNYNTRENKTWKNPADSSRNDSHKKTTYGAFVKLDQGRAGRGEGPTRTGRKTAASEIIQAPKDKKNIRGREDSKTDTGSRAATHGPPIQGNLMDDSKAQISIQGKLHDETGKPGTKEERRTPHPKDDNRDITSHQDVPGRRRFKRQDTLRGLQDRDADSLSNTNPAGARSPEPTYPPAQVCQRGEEPAPGTKEE